MASFARVCSEASSAITRLSRHHRAVQTKEIGNRPRFVPVKGARESKRDPEIL
jgi:hypothetical protein